MEIVAALVVGGVAGWVLGRRTARTPAAQSTARQMPGESGLSRKLTRRQRRIVEALPSDPPRPSLGDLIAEEAADLGIPAIAADTRIPLATKLQVYRRDAPSLTTTTTDDLEFVIVDETADPLDTDHVQLVERTTGNG